MSTPTGSKLANVFGSSREIPETYVTRSGVDDRLINDITRDKHIVIHGSSKQGKTCLRRYNLGDNDYIVIQCTREYAKGSFFEMLLKHAGVKCEVSQASTLRGSRKLHATVTGEGKVPFIAKASTEAGVESEKEKETQLETKDFEIDPEDPNDVVRVLKAAGFSKYIVIEDFHYLDEDVQQSLAFDLKVFHEISNLIFIVVGVWLEANKLTMYNGDLIGRVAVINADHWDDSHLRQVIDKGASLLNIRLEDDVKSRLVNGCQGNVGLLQEVCYRLCEKHNIWNTQHQLHDINQTSDVDEMFRDIAEEQAARYRNFVARFAEGLGETQLEMYKWIAYVVMTSHLDDLRRGLRPNAIFHRIKPHHPDKDSLQQNNVTQALERVGKVQFKHKLQPLIFDFSNGELVIVDANFLNFIQTHSHGELLEYIGIDLTNEITNADST